MGYLFRHSGFRALFGAQALGAFNDNAFKMLVSLYAVDTASGSHTGVYVSLVGIIFVLPYFSFCGYAGYVVDKFNKRQVLIVVKGAEILVMLMASMALVASRLDILMAVLFLLATQMTFFSPVKYGILPEMLPSTVLSQAIGLLDMGRYIFVIVGTAFAGLLLKWWADTPAIIGAFLVGVAFAGFAIGQWVPSVPGSGAIKQFRVNPLAEIGDGLARIARDSKLISVVVGTSFVDFLGTFVMLDMILVGKEVMHVRDESISMLAAFAGLGVSLGSIAGGRLSRGQMDLGLVPFGTIGAGISIAMMTLTATSYFSIVSFIGLVGFCGGFSTVALSTSLQRNVSDHERGHLLSTNNFLNMVGVLVASCMLWLMHDAFRMGPLDILLFLAIATLILTFCALKWLPDYAASLAGWMPMFAPVEENQTGLE